MWYKLMIIICHKEEEQMIIWSHRNPLLFDFVFQQLSFTPPPHLKANLFFCKRFASVSLKTLSMRRSSGDRDLDSCWVGKASQLRAGQFVLFVFQVADRK